MNQAVISGVKTAVKARPIYMPEKAKPLPLFNYILAKTLGAMMWSWIFWRMKHDWRFFIGHPTNPSDEWLDKHGF